MKDLKDISIATGLNRESFERIGDLINIDGPLLSLFHDKLNGALLLYDWMDNDQYCNRYIIYQIAPKNILAFISKKITHIQLFSQAESGVYFYADIDRRKLSEYKIYRLKSLPEEYSATENNYFSEEYCTDTGDMLLRVSRIMASVKTNNNYKSSSNLSAFALSATGLLARINLIKGEHLKTDAADVRQTYNLPEVERMALLSAE